MPSIVHIYKTYLPETIGGGERVIFELAEGAVKAGFDVSVIYLSDKETEIDNTYFGHVTHSFRKTAEIASTPFVFSNLAKIRQLILAADIVHYHYPWPFADLLHLLFGRGSKSVVTYHADIIKQRFLERLYAPVRRLFLSDVTRIVATSEPYVTSSKVLGSYTSKLGVIPLGLSESLYPRSNEALVARFQQRFGNNFFLFIGALRSYKGLDSLLDAAKTTEFPIVIGGSGELASHLAERIASEGLLNVHLLGTISDDEKVALLKACSIFVFPSHQRSEAFGLSLVEAAMMSKPMISCELGTGTSFVNKAGETGEVVQPNDSQALSHSMRILSESESLRETYGLNARSRFERLFRAEIMVDKYLNLYRQLIQKDKE